MGIPYVPRFIDISVTFRYTETDCSVVIKDSVYSVWTLKSRLSKFPGLWLCDHNFVLGLIIVRNARGILSFIILANKSLASVLDILPIGFKGDVVDGIATKY